MIINAVQITLSALIATAEFPLLRGSTPYYAYSNMSGGAPVTFFKSLPEVAIGDQVVAAKNCSSNTLVCLEAETIVIALPTAHEGKSSNGTLSRVVDELDSEFLGFKAHVKIIDATRGVMAYRYWYSNEVGLLAFSVQMQHQESVMFLLRGREGLKAGIAIE